MPSLLKSLGLKNRRSNNNNKKASSRGNIFRKPQYQPHKSGYHQKLETPTGGEYDGEVHQDLTWTMSEDSVEVSLDVIPQFKEPSFSSSTKPDVVSLCSGKAKEETSQKEVTEEEEKTLTFTEKEVAQNQLHHMLEMLKKEQELEQLRKYHSDMMEQMKKDAATSEAELRVHYSKLIESMKEETLVQVEEWYSQILKEQSFTLARVEQELKETKTKLKDTLQKSKEQKENLRIVSAKLMETQRALFLEREQQQQQDQQPLSFAWIKQFTTTGKIVAEVEV